MKQDEELLTSVEIGTLTAFYGGLLTEKQRDALRMHFGEDYSLGEIAAELGTSRQSVHELITRSAQKLRYYEKMLGLVQRARETADDLKTVRSRLAALQLPDGQQETLNSVIDTLGRVIGRQEGEENEYGI